MELSKVHLSLLCRGSGDSMHTRKAPQHGKPLGVSSKDNQPDAREGQVGRLGVTERPVVLPKSGNADGGKGPWFKIDVRSMKGQEIGKPINSD